MFVGDDWAEDHHDVEIQDESGRRLARPGCPRAWPGSAGCTSWSVEHLATTTSRAGPGRGRDRDRPGAVGAGAGRGRLQVYAVNPLQAARYRERHGARAPRATPADAHTLADMVRTDRHQLRPVAGDSDAGRGGQGGRPGAPDADLGTDPARQRLRSALREYFPAALEASEDLDRRRHPGAASRHRTRPRGPADPAQITAALKRARRRTSPSKAEQIQTALRAEQLAQPAAVTAAYAATVRGAGRRADHAQRADRDWRRRWRRILASTRTLRSTWPARTRRHPRRPGARRVRRRPRPLRRRQGPQELRRHQPDHPRLRQEEGRPGPLRPQRPPRRRAGRQAFSALSASPGARAYYDQPRARGAGHNAALRQLANRLVGILHGCLKTHTLYDEETAWPTSTKSPLDP